MARNGRALPLALTAVLVLGALVPAAARAQATFTTAHAVTLKGRQSGSNVFTAGGVEKTCPVVNFSGRLSGNSKRLKLIPQYGVPIFSGCVAKTLGGLHTKFAASGCFYVLHAHAGAGDRNRWRASMDIGCPNNYSLIWYLYENKEAFALGETLCTTEIQAQTGLGTAELSNVKGAPGKIAIHWNLTGIRYVVQGSKLLCGPVQQVRRDASLRGSAVIAARTSSGQPAGLSVSG